MGDLLAGAVVGAVVGELLKKVIDVAKLAHRCKRNCESLVAALNSISPLLDSVATSANGNETCQAWLESINDLLVKAESLVEKCKRKKWRDRVKFVERSKLSSQLLEIERQIRMKIPESSLITLGIVQAIVTMMMRGTSNPVLDSIPASKMQDIPSKTMPFVANPFEKFKSIIIGAVTARDASITIGLKGRGGAGKTLLAKMIHNDKDIQSKYGAESIMWITVGRETTVASHYKTMAKLMRDGGDYERDYAHRHLEDQRQYLLYLFKKKKILLILDDVWDNDGAHNFTMMKWLDIAKGVGSVTLVTTRQSFVLRCAKAKEVMDVQSLSKHDSWELFCIHAFGGEKPPSSGIEGIAKEVCEECDGLPLAIKVIGSAMWEKTNERDWSNVLKYLKGSTSMPHSKSVENDLQRELYNHLQYSYDELDESSKNCFLYFVAFPEDYRIRTDYLFRIWYAEQLFGSKNAEEVSDVGRGILINLADRSLIEMSENEGSVHIHDVLRDLAIRILNNAKPHEWAFECYFHPGKVLETFPAIGKEVKRMSLMGCSIWEFPNILELPLLQVCILSEITSVQNKRRLEIPPHFFSITKNMRMLDIRGGDGVKDIGVNLEGLEFLLYLDMSSYISLEKLSESIKELKSLTHLDLRWCSSLTELPESIKGLNSLTHLDLNMCYSLKELPESIKEVTSLTHLDLMGCKSLMELPESIKELKSLTHLNLSECYSLKELPKNIKELKSLIHLDLRWCESFKKLPESMKGLESLTHLNLNACESLKELPKSIKELKSLTHLDLSSCESLKELPESIKELKFLTHLDLRGCKSLKELPESIKELKFLTYLKLSGC